MNTKATLRLLGALGFSCALFFGCSDDTTAPTTDGPITVDSTVDGNTVAPDTGAADGVTADTAPGPDATVDTVDCECRPGDGPCCDGCFYYTLTDAHVCESVEEFKCEDVLCGSDALKRVGERVCQGFTATCEGDQTWGDWTTHEACDESSTCVSADSTSAACNVCAHDCDPVTNACWADCNPLDGCCQADGTACPYGCDTATSVCWAECDPTGACCDADGTACDRGCDVNGDVHAAGTCWPTTCTAATADQCEHGVCADGQCCDTACSGTCKACNLAGSEGTCTDAGSGTDPDDECGAFTCNGSGACYTNCDCNSSYKTSCASSRCKSGNFCADPLLNAAPGMCSGKKNNGVACSFFGTERSPWECKSNFCVATAYELRKLGDGDWYFVMTGAKCCNSACSDACQDCQTGTCTDTAENAGPVRPFDCNGFSCNGNGRCKDSCPANIVLGVEYAHGPPECHPDFWCYQDACHRDKETGSCASNAQCIDGSCVLWGC